MRHRWRVLRTMIGFAFAADRVGATVQIGLAVLNAMSVAQAVGIKLLVDAVVQEDLTRAIWGAVIVAGLGAIGRAANNVGHRHLTTLQERVDLLLDRRIMTLTNDIPTLEHFEQPEYADELELLRQGRPDLTHVLTGLVGGLITVVQGVIAIGLLAALHPALVFLPLFSIPSLLTVRRAQKILIGADEAVADRRRLLAHLFRTATTAGPAKELRIFGLEAEMDGRHDHLWNEVTRETSRAHLKATAWSAAGWAVFAAGFVAAVAIVAFEAVDGRRSPGDVALAVSLASQVDRVVTAGVDTLGFMIRSLTVAGRLVWLEEYAASKMVEIDDPAPAPAGLTAGIALHDVTFRYPGTDVDVLSHIDLVLPAGAVVAVVGENGAGKTTLVKLLARMYEPTSGHITVDDVPLSRIPTEEWRSRLSGGFQDFAKYEFVARENVGVGDLPRIEDGAAVDTALERASAADVIRSLTDGLDTQLGRTFSAGAELSGGQWQKLALGRAMMRDAPLLLVLDEPTAALDADAEHELFERYAGAARETASRAGGITLLVSHRFSTVRMADLIVVLDGGRLRERGTHAELMARGDLYAELFAMQARSYR